MPVHGTHYTKTHLSELIRMVEHGHVITITRNQAPVALLLRIGAVPQPRRPGSLRALMTIDAALDDAPALDVDAHAPVADARDHDAGPHAHIDVANAPAAAARTHDDGAHAHNETPTPSLTATSPDP